MFSKISGPLWPRDRPVGIGSRKGDVATTEKPIEALAFISTASTGTKRKGGGTLEMPLRQQHLITFLRRTAGLGAPLPQSLCCSTVV